MRRKLVQLVFQVGSRTDLWFDGQNVYDKDGNILKTRPLKDLLEENKKPIKQNLSK
jgi:hypothetical protein